MKGRHRRKLHETPPEIKNARQAWLDSIPFYKRKFIDEIKAEEEEKREKIRNMKMPSHPAPSPRSWSYGRWSRGPWKPPYFESKAAFQRRYKKWAKRFRKNDSHDSSST